MLELERLIGQSVEKIDTPALVIDLDAMERNLHKMQSYANEKKVKLRPHAKMHKCAALAKLQMQVGAVGVCVQKLSELQRMAEHGVADIYLSNEISSLQKYELLAHILRSQNNQKTLFSIAVDSILGIQMLAKACASGLPKPLNVLIEIDVGQQRSGIAPGAAALPLAQEIFKHSFLRFAGLQAYHGKAQHLRSALERKQTLDTVLSKVKLSISALQDSGIETPLVTGAGSGSFMHEATSGVYGELQAGSYLFMDADYAANAPDPAQPQFEHALFVKSRVMSRHTHSGDDRSVVDAGHKSHAIDSGLPKIWAGHAADWQFFNGGDEHGILRGSHLPAWGDVVWLIPGHCDPTVNLHDQMIGVRGGLKSGGVEKIFNVDTRGCLA